MTAEFVVAAVAVAAPDGRIPEGSVHSFEAGFGTDGPAAMGAGDRAAAHRLVNQPTFCFPAW